MKEKILVVEDDHDIRQILRLYLEKHEYQVFGADHGQQGLEQFAKISPDLVILDVLLPDMEGTHVCQEIREKSNVPIIFLSCKRETEDIIGGLELGGDDYMTKPFDPNILLARVKAHLRRKTLIDQGQDDQIHAILSLGEELTPREREILFLIEQGLTNKEIAEKLHITLGTVKGYNNNIFSKLRVKNRTQAISRAREIKLINH